MSLGTSKRSVDTPNKHIEQAGRQGMLWATGREAGSSCATRSVHALA